MKRKVSIIVLLALIIGLVPSNNVSAARKISISKKSISLTVGKSKKLKLNNAKKSKVKWSSSKKKVAIVSKSGKVTAKKKGTAKITAKYLGKKYSCKVIVKSKVSAATKQSSAASMVQPTGKPTEGSTSIQYISDTQVDYDSTNKEHRLLFGFRCTTDGDRVATSGNVMINIENSNGDLIYSEDVDFGKDDFSFWKNPFWSDSPRYLCCIYIPDSEIIQSLYDTGTISFTVTIKEGVFNTQTLNISNLPVKEPTLAVSVAFPNEFSFVSSVGKTLTQTTINSGIYTFTKNTSGYHLNIKLLATLTYQYDDTKNMSKISYKLINSDGIVVSSGSMIKTMVDLGDTFYFDKSIYDLEYDDYILVLDDYKI